MNTATFPLKGKRIQTGHLVSNFINYLAILNNNNFLRNKPMGYCFKTKKIKISIPEKIETELVTHLYEHMLKLSSVQTKFQEILEFLDMKNQTTLDTTLRYLGIYYQRKNNSIVFTSQQSKLPNEFNNLFFHQLEKYIEPGSYIMWKGEDGDIFGQFYKADTSTSFDGVKGFNQVNAPFLMKDKLEKTLSKKEGTLIKKKI